MIKVQKGTTKFFESSPCNTCQYAAIIRGEAESEVLVKCHDINRIIPFIVKNCSSYVDKNSASIRAMESLAWILGTNEKNHVGFKPPTPKQRISPYEDIDGF